MQQRPRPSGWNSPPYAAVAESLPVAYAGRAVREQATGRGDAEMGLAMAESHSAPLQRPCWAGQRQRGASSLLQHLWQSPRQEALKA